MNALELTRAALSGEVWRLWTAHLLHWDVAHLLLNVAAVVPLLFLRPRVSARFVAIALFVAAPIISVVVLLTSNVDRYRGASALVVMLWILLPVRAFGTSRRERIYACTLLAAVAVKVAYELAAGPLAWHSGAWSTVPQSHLAGAILGLIAALPRSAGVSRPRP